MADPRSQLSSQDLLFAATALRAQATRSAEDAARPAYASTQEVFALAADSERKLVDKTSESGSNLGQDGESANETPQTAGAL